ncbi:MAG: helix-turn-helix domain-containing protein, partial [Oscillospiraceae bacterium]|nr:helix-turn-helix domain-containing protein [Oscillospiraceae bacterium]
SSHLNSIMRQPALQYSDSTKTAKKRQKEGGVKSMAIEATRMYTPEEAAKLLGNLITAETVVRYIKEKRLRAAKISGARGYLVSGADLLAFYDVNATRDKEYPHHA